VLFTDVLADEINSSIQLLSPEEVQHIRTTVETSTSAEAAQALSTLSRVYLNWPSEHLVVVVDLLRMLATIGSPEALTPAVDWASLLAHTCRGKRAYLLAWLSLGVALRHTSCVLVVAQDAGSGPLVMLAFRLLSNAVPVLERTQAGTLVSSLLFVSLDQVFGPHWSLTACVARKALRLGLSLDAGSFKPAHLLAMATVALK
jgi:hypothetical protein